jgi:hypothetical protein
VGWFLHSVVPQLLLSRVKGRVARSEYYSGLLPGAREAETALDAVLKEAAEPRLGLEKLEALGARIARGQATLIESASSVEETIETLGVATRNLELVMEDPTWGDQRQVFEEPLLGDLRLLLEQMKTDLRYLMITRGQADLALQSLQTTAGVRGAQWERRLALLLAIFAFGGVAQVFLELAWGWRLGIVLGGVPLVALGYMLLRR